jgi:hypothetical protein
MHETSSMRPKHIASRRVIRVLAESVIVLRAVARGLSRRAGWAIVERLSHERRLDAPSWLAADRIPPAAPPPASPPASEWGASSPTPPGH